MTDWPIAIVNGWHPIATFAELGRRRPTAATLLGQRLVAFRSGDQVSIFHDRCPHRGAPLSHGRLVDGGIVCPYHGWLFDSAGRCIDVPGADSCPTASARVLPVRVAADLVWTSLAEQPPPFPTLPDTMSDPALDRFWWQLAPSEAGLLDALENHLDPSHPHFVHPWLVRSPDRRRRVQVDVRSGSWGAEAVYVEERRSAALLPAVMEGRRARSIGRLWPPTIGEVRLESARGAALSICVVFAPVDHGVTRPWAHFASTRGWLPARFKQVALKAFHWPVLRQDRRILQLQQRNRDGAPYVTGPLDVLATAIWQHANNQPCPETTIQLEMRL